MTILVDHWSRVLTATIAMVVVVAAVEAIMEGCVELVEAHPLVLPVEVVQFYSFVGAVGGEGCRLGWRHHAKDEGSVGPRESPVLIQYVVTSDASTE